MPKVVNLKEGDEVKILFGFKIHVVEGRRGYIEMDEIRLVYDFDANEIVGWYKP